MAFEPLENRKLLAFDPTAAEQELLQLTNRFRADPAGEFSRLIAVTAPIQAHDPKITQQLRLAGIQGVNGALLKKEMQALAPAPPLSWNPIVHDLATTHITSMIAAGPPQRHMSDLTKNLQARGVPVEGIETPAGLAGASQNVFGYGESPLFIHAAYIIDWTTDETDVDGMQSPRGHRNSLIQPAFNQIGAPIVAGKNGFGPLVNTQFLAKIASAQKLAVGAVFEDKNKSGWYEAGEGIGGVQIVFVGTSGRFTTTAMSAGGYQIALPAGTYSVTAQGGRMRHAIALPKVTVGTSNVWQNLVYDPAVIPPDAMEPNNSSAVATDLGSIDQTLTALSIHTADTDFFKVNPRGTGAATFELRFTHTSGNLDLQLFNAAGSKIASSITTGSLESITAHLVRGLTYYIQVFSSTNATNGQFSLNVNLPEPASPTAALDRGMTTQGSGPIRLALLDNDSDPDGSRAALTPTLQTVGKGIFAIQSDKSLSFTPAAGFSGIDRATYRVTDDQGLNSGNATIEVLVLNYTSATPWRSARQPLDINDDGAITPLDALIVINTLVARGAGRLPTSLAASIGIVGLVDSNGSNSLEPLDALLVINELNRMRNRNAEGEAASYADLAIPQLMADDFAAEPRKKRR